MILSQAISRSKIPSAHELAKSDKERLKGFSPRSLSGKFCVSYTNPNTTIFCNTEEKRERVIKTLNRENIKIFET
jgi:hypothetical protein